MKIAHRPPPRKVKRDSIAEIAETFTAMGADSTAVSSSNLTHRARLAI